MMPPFSPGWSTQLKLSQLDSRPAQYATLVFLALVWGSSFILMKRGLDYFDSTEVAAYRMSIAMIVLLPISLRNLHVIRGRFWALFFTGLFGNALPAFLFVLAQTQISSSLVGMLNSLTSIFTLLIGVLFFRMRSRLLQVVGVLIALVGSLGVIGFEHLMDLSTHGRYSLLCVGATACYGTAVNIIKTHLKDVRPRDITSLSFLLTAPALLLYLLAFTDFVPQLATQPESWRGLMYISLLGVVCTGLAVMIFNQLIKQTTTVFASSVVYLIPVVALGWGVLDGETVEPTQSGYLVLILVGILLISRPIRLRSKPPVSA